MLRLRTLNRRDRTNRDRLNVHRCRARIAVGFIMSGLVALSAGVAIGLGDHGKRKVIRYFGNAPVLEFPRFRGHLSAGSSDPAGRMSRHVEKQEGTRALPA